MEILNERIRAKRLAELAGVSVAAPWKSAEKELAAALDAQKRHEAEESERRELAEAEQFGDAYRAHVNARAEIVELERREAELNQKIEEFGEKGRSAYARCADSLSHAAGQLTVSQLRDRSKPSLSRKLPSGVTADQFLLADEIHGLMVSAQNFRRQLGNQKDELAKMEQRFPALADLR